MPRLPLLVLFALLVAGCPRPGPDEPVPDPVDVDCSALPDTLQPETTVPGAKAYKGLAFDADGMIVGSDTSSLIKASRSGDWDVFLPGVGEVEGMVYLPGGDLVVTTSWGDGAMRRITPGGGISTLAADLGAYSVVLGPDGKLWAAGWDGAWRVDPDSGAVETLISSGYDAPWSPRTVAFSRDLSRVYFGTVDDSGRIFFLELNGSHDPVGSPQVFVSGVGNGWHDGLGMDGCGNLWAAEFESSSLYRISADGEVEKMVDWSSDRDQFGHGLAWGSGQGGWRADALYLPVPEGDYAVKEIVVGVPAATFPE